VKPKSGSTCVAVTAVVVAEYAAVAAVGDCELWMKTEAQWKMQ